MTLPKPTTKGTFADRLRRLRQQREWSQAALAQRTGFTANYIYHVENDGCQPRLTNLRLFAQAFDMTLSELLEGVE